MGIKKDQLSSYGVFKTIYVLERHERNSTEDALTTYVQYVCKISRLILWTGTVTKLIKSHGGDGHVYKLSESSFSTHVLTSETLFQHGLIHKDFLKDLWC